MPVIALCADGWRTPENFYQALLPRLGAPDWHGHNLDALHNSLCPKEAVISFKPPL